jgi:hypothetical protein
MGENSCLKTMIKVGVEGHNTTFAGDLKRRKRIMGATGIEPVASSV